MPAPSLKESLLLGDTLKSNAQNRLLTNEQIRSAQAVNALNDLKIKEYPEERAYALKKRAAADQDAAIKRVVDSMDFVTPENYAQYAKMAINDWKVPPEFFPNPETMKDPMAFAQWHKDWRAHFQKMDQQKSLKLAEFENQKNLEGIKHGNKLDEVELTQNALNTRAAADRESRERVAETNIAGRKTAAEIAAESRKEAARIRAGAGAKGLTPEKAAARITNIRRGIATLDKTNTVDQMLATMLSDKLDVDVPTGSQLDPTTKKEYIDAAMEEIRILEKIVNGGAPAPDSSPLEIPELDIGFGFGTKQGAVVKQTQDQMATGHAQNQTPVAAPNVPAAVSNRPAHVEGQIYVNRTTGERYQWINGQRKDLPPLKR